MKKICLILALACVTLFPSVAQDNTAKKAAWDHGDNVSSLTYQTVSVYKIYDTKDAYVVLYEMQGLKMGQAVLPKKWTENTNNARKMLFRDSPKGLNPYMTVIKQDGNFLKVWLTIPSDRKHAVWGVYPSGTPVEGTDAESLELKL